MNTIITVWVLVVSPSSNQNSPIISLPMADIVSCQRVQQAMAARGSNRGTTCVEISIVK